jgi:hypothetical protein
LIPVCRSLAQHAGLAPNEPDRDSTSMVIDAATRIMTFYVMRRVVAPLLILITVPCGGQTRSFRIGSIDFFGTKDVDVAQMRTTLPIREGDTLTEAKFEEVEGQVSSIVKKITSAPPTDFSAVCCDSKGAMMVYIGLRGENFREVHRLPPPNSMECLPKSAVSLYNRTVNESLSAIRSNQAGEDHSKGYALSQFPPLRQTQLALRAYAVDHSNVIERALQNCQDAENRAAAAELLGYANLSRQQIDTLVRASDDSNLTVRNNATRALWVLASSSEKAAAMIPASHFVALLNSGKWQDRNKAGLLLMALTKYGDPGLLSNLRSQALDSLVEMARWHDLGHADPYRFLLGRIAGTNPDRIQQLVEHGKVEDLVSAAEHALPTKSHEWNGRGHKIAPSISSHSNHRQWTS